MRIVPLALAGVTAILSMPTVAAQPVVKVGTVEEGALGGLRDRLQSALLESGVIRLSTIADGQDIPEPDYVVTGRVGAAESAAQITSASDYCVGGTQLAVSLDIRVRDARGQVVFGGMVNASAELGSDTVGGGDSCSSMTPANPSFRRLGNALALAAARRVAFTLVPLRVARMEGRDVVLNHGGALLPLGAIIQIAGSDGRAERYRVTVSTPASANAEAMGASTQVAPGAIARVLENDDAQSNARRFRKVELP